MQNKVLYFIFLYIYQKNKIMEEKYQIVPDYALSKESLNQLKTELNTANTLLECPLRS